jgi:3-oxoacyl-[acyl-carrier protein] reductase
MYQMLQFFDAENVIDEIVKDFGSVDILVNNAGITRDTLLMRMTEEQWDQVLTVNLKSVFNLTKAAIRPMMKQKNGSIINMSSVVGVSGNAGQANYSASKAGIIGFTKSVAKELGSRNVRCNAIAPGFILTEMTSKLPEDVKSDWIAKIPLRRGGLPEDVANVALFLAPISPHMSPVRPSVSVAVWRCKKVWELINLLYLHRQGAIPSSTRKCSET